MLLSMNMSAFALTYTVSTTYTTGAEAEVTVRYTAKGNEQVTVLAEDKNNNIVYIDQEAVDNATTFDGTFNFKVDLAAATYAGPSSVKVGSTSTAAAIPAATQKITLDGKEVTVKANGEGVVSIADLDVSADVQNVIVDDTTVEQSITGTAYGTQAIVYALPAAGYQATSYKVDNGEAQAIIGSASNAFAVSITGDCTIEVTFTEVEATGTVTVSASSFTNVDGDLVLIGTAGGTDDFGMLLSTEAIAAGAEVKGYAGSFKAGEAYMFPALAKNEAGQFSVTIEDAPADTYYAKAYANDGAALQVAAAPAASVVVE